jgi:hypothetical protein
MYLADNDILRMLLTQSSKDGVTNMLTNFRTASDVNDLIEYYSILPCEEILKEINSTYIRF